MRAVSGYASFGPGEELRPREFTRRDLRADDVAVRVTHVGVCRSDLHAVEAMPARLIALGLDCEDEGAADAVA